MSFIKTGIYGLNFGMKKYKMIPQNRNCSKQTAEQVNLMENKEELL